MKKIIITLCTLPVIFQAALILNCVTVMAHTHTNTKLTRETKIIAITILAEARGEGEKGRSKGREVKEVREEREEASPPLRPLDSLSGWPLAR